MAKQAVKKKDLSNLSKLEVIKQFKKDNNLNGAKDKELEWIVLPPAFQEAIKIPGIPKGFFSVVRGLPNTGKSTIKLQLIAACQRQGILPVIYETENNFPWDHAKMCGVEFEDVYEEVVDEETGEITKEVVDHDGFFIYYDSDKLFEQYGKIDHSDGSIKTKPTRPVAVIEDISYSINEYLNKQESGELPMEMCFIWDSVGSLRSYRSVTSNVNNNQWDAGAMSQCFSTITNNRIPSSRKEGKEFTNTFFAVNKIWIDNMQMGGPQVKNKGGNEFAYGARLLIHLGGITSPSVEKLKATSSGETYYYGICTKIRIEKNQVNDITYEGKICSLPHGLWSPRKEALDEYKKTHMKFLMDRLSEISGKDFDENCEIELDSEPEK